MPRPDHVYVISDLHLGPEGPLRIFHAGEALARFIAMCAGKPGRVELVILGDALDFLQVKSDLDTRSGLDMRPEPAVDKVKQIIAGNPGVFAQLAEFCAKPDKSLVWVIGNHDLELAFPAVQGTLANALGNPSNLTWVVHDNQWKYELFGGREIRLIHGNKGDPFNHVDYAELSDVAARGGDADYVYPLGSRLVAHVFNPLKADGYTHVDLLKPEIGVTLPLTLALQPQNTWERIKTACSQINRPNLRSLASAAVDYLKVGTALYGESPPGMPPPSEEEQIMACLLAPLLSETNPDERLVAWLEELDHEVPLLDSDEPTYGFFADRASMLLRGIARHFAHGDPFDLFGLDELSSRFPRFHDQGVDLLIAGHTHLARVHEWSSGYYMNTGTWADLLRLPSHLKTDELATAMRCLGPQATPIEKLPFWQRPFRRLTYIEIDLTNPKSWSAALHQWPEEPRPALAQIP
jgi:UDP-2,3-diacylglucosamine pyrophosphatase LpxH